MGGAGSLVPPQFCWGGVGAAKGLLPWFLVPKGNQPTACILALWWLKFGLTEGGGWGGSDPPRTTSKSHIGELAPMALCDTHVAGCGEHLPAWGLCVDPTPGTHQAVRGGPHGQKSHSGFPPRKVDARGSADARCSADARSSADACLSWQKVQGREANRRRHRLTEPTTKALCQTPPLGPPDFIVGNNAILRKEMLI